MATSKQILAIAAREIGYHEGANKQNKYGEWYASTFSPPEPMWNGQPWCMEFVQWVYHEAVADLPFKTASCGALLRWYREHQPECVRTVPVPGCIVIFDFPNTAYDTDHTGIFVTSTPDKITTIDGNTSNESEGNGGWVQQRTRSIIYANPTYIVPRELKEDDMDIDQLIDDFTPEQVYRLACKLDEVSLYKLYSRLEDYMATLPLPTSWDAATELRESMFRGITDGSRPMVPARRYETAIMCKRAVANER